MLSLTDNAWKEALIPTYNRFPIRLSKGKGTSVWDQDGEHYLDFTSGIATCNLGHVNEFVKQRVESQLSELWHCSNLFEIPSQEQLAQKLVDTTFGNQVFFCNSGAEANEAAIKLARSYAQTVKQSNAFEIVTFTSSFHGRTMATLSATAQEKIQKGFSPLVSGFRHLPYNDLTALEQIVSEQTCAVLLELVQGEGGVIPADVEWVKALEAICKEHGILLMIDEVQTGIGRTGSLFAYEQYGIRPDVVSVAKGLGNGIPIGAIIATNEAAKGFRPGAHGSTFGGNPVATTAGLSTLTYIEEQAVLQQVKVKSDYIFSELKQLQKERNIIKDVRGKGLLIGIELEGNAIDTVLALQRQHILTLIAGQHVLRVLPPLTVSTEEIDQFIFCLKSVV
ncbi:acetylornithine transaminase [Radiobacillus deserti]|uniref:Acetylornithine aminotransferase n=1 Tax=Radiobacillus deserti TaxID=2594883 RepID=A0A516KK88_9BACI|nr:acetylornithine transaminase [Radiobacillus deserti]QDP41814.1 acetylornithine transaminase [Radiobacillus deserti]